MKTLTVGSEGERTGNDRESQCDDSQENYIQILLRIFEFIVNYSLNYWMLLKVYHKDTIDFYDRIQCFVFYFLELKANILESIENHV